MLNAVRNDYRVLDADDFAVPSDVRLVSHERMTRVDDLAVEYIAPGRLANLFRWCSPLFNLLYAVRLFFAADPKTVILVNGGAGYFWLLLGYLNRLPFVRHRTLLLWDVFVEYKLGKEKRLKFFPLIKIKTSWKESIARGALLGYDLAVQWSKKQVGTHAKYFRLPEEKFIFLPFKANHSKNPPFDIPIGNFIFSGGNGKRDYKCLIDAVRGTNIPVIISATDPQVRKTIDPLPHVIVLGAPEPAFGQLQAASRFVVVPMICSGLKGGGEANFCNGMWHRKPVIGVCSIAAEDYILDGETGYVVPSGDSKLLRERILELWNDPKKCEAMGEKGHEHVVRYFTHEKFIRRLLRLALLLGKEKC